LSEALSNKSINSPCATVRWAPISVQFGDALKLNL